MSFAVGPRNTLLSPLRYPGSKRQLVHLIADYVESLGRPVHLFVEPFAGGASVALQLAAWGKVSSIVLADKDPLVYSFWKIAAFDTEWLIQEMREIEVSLPMWEKMTSWQPRSTRDRAIKCLFLNRTSFSGILHEQAGPLGGKSQRSKYSIDCRFPKETLERRLRQISALANDGRIHAVWPYSYETTVKRIRQERGQRNVFFFFDPPFFAKAQKLYAYSFKLEEHNKRGRFFSRLRFPSVLSYDNHPEVKRLYGGSRRLEHIVMEYRGSAGHNTTTYELIVTNLKTKGGSE